MKILGIVILLGAFGLYVWRQWKKKSGCCGGD